MINYQNIQVRNTMKTQLTILTALVAFGLGTATAGDVTGLTTFSSGTTARASEVNGNFSAVKTAVDDNQTQILALQALVVALTARVEMLENSSVHKLDGVLDLTGMPGSPGATAVFTGVNVQIVDGSGTTLSGGNLGNLIVGYDRNSGSNLKTGAHNVVIGNDHSYTGSAGLVAGFENTVSGFASSVTGGRRNTASANYASVSGGSSNVASVQWSSVSGGVQNQATGFFASVSGGAFNEASGASSSVSGGGGEVALEGNTASGDYASVSGGARNQATFDKTTVSGGQANRAGNVAGTAGLAASVSGGAGNAANADFSSVSGGEGNDADARGSSVSGGNGVATGMPWDWRAGSLEVPFP
jgi:hypothetical protein